MKKPTSKPSSTSKAKDQPAKRAIPAAKPAPVAAPVQAKPPRHAMEAFKNVTPMPDATTAFLKEVDEALQQERLMAIWHRSKWFVLAGVLLLLLAAAAQQTWLAWRQHQARTLAAQWYAYTELQTDSERLKQLPNLLHTTTGGTHSLAVYAQAAMQHTGAEKAKAYMQVVNDTTAPQWLRDLSRLNAAIALVGSNPAEAKTQLEILAQSNVEQLPSPAYAPALELLALIAQQNGDNATAKGYTEKLLQQSGLPADMRQRALQRYGTLGGTAKL